MRGNPVDLIPPRSGLVANVPPHMVPRDALIDGSNMFLDIDGLYKPRFGYQPLISPGPNIGPVNGVWWYVDLDGSNQYLAVSPTDVATVKLGAWTTITGINVLTGSLADPVVFQNYFQNDLMNVVICNNHDPLWVWNTSLPSIQLLTPTVALSGVNAYTGFTLFPGFSAYPVNTQFFVTVPTANTGATTFNLNSVGPVPVMALVNGVLTPFSGGELQPGIIYNFSFDGTEMVLGTNLQAPVARSIASIGGRILAVNVLNGNIRNFVQAVWTTTFDFTVWPALAFYNFVDEFDDPLVGVAPIGNGAGIIYGTQSAYLAQTVSGVTDPFAFQFSEIRGFTTGPVSPTAIVVAEGLHYFLGTDGRIWQTDGSSVQTISQAIDPVVIADFNFSLQSQVVGVYYPKYRQIWWMYPSNSQ
jgi:hypothetical protein